MGACGVVQKPQRDHRVLSTRKEHGDGLRYVVDESRVFLYTPTIE
jgi:hypothetical protein